MDIQLKKVLLTIFEENGIKANLLSLKTNHSSDIMKELIDAKYVCVGSPTLNNGMLPSVAHFLTYMKGLAPKNRKGLAFGSYGWGGQSIEQVEEMMVQAGFEMFEKVRVNYVPDEKSLNDIKEKLKEVL